MDEVRISKFMSLVLRHEPETLGIKLDPEGWTDFAGFASRMHARFGVTEQDLVRLVATNPKRRFVIRDGRIRANQGHSVEVNLGLESRPPPAVLFHGTTEQAYEKIRLEGLKKIDRTHVHLSPDTVTAEKTAVRRRGPWALLSISAGKMAADGASFFMSENGVWLTDAVAPEYLQLEKAWGKK